MSSRNGNRLGEEAAYPVDALSKDVTEYSSVGHVAPVAAILSPPRLPIRAELSGSRHCSALGIVVDAYAPVLALARRLIDAGLPPDRVLEVYRSGTLCFRVRLSVAARLTVEDGSNGAPRFRQYHPPSWEVGPPIAPNGQTLSGQQPSGENNAPLASLTEGGTR
jgi:hypothetical protein